MKDIELKISRFIDNELPFEEQGEFFKALSLNEEARVILNDFMQMKKDIEKHYMGVNSNLSKVKLPTGIKVKEKNIYKKMFYFSAAAVVVILLGSSFLFSNLINTKSELSSYKESLKKVSSEFEEYKKEKSSFKTVLAQANEPVLKLSNGKKGLLNESHIVNKPQAEKESYEKKMLLNSQRGNIEVVQITRADFLTTPMIGN